MNYAEADSATERLSIEWTADEVEFYYGQRMNRRAIEQAFGLATAAPTGKGAPVKSKGGCLNTLLIIVIVFVIRTALEDRTLQAELPGYTGHAQRVRYRLVPGVW